MAIRLAFIASLSHSGSTLLDLLLSGHPDVVGLGEVDAMVAPHRRNHWTEVAPWSPCSCGVPLLECPLWGPHVERLRERPDDSAIDHLQALLRFLDEHGKNKLYIDSSKHRGPLERLLHYGHQLPTRDELKVIHLIRDARGYASSGRRRFGRRSLGGIRHLLHWYRENRRLERVLTLNEVPNLLVGYEELCFDTEATVERICGFLDISPLPARRLLGGRRGHVATGNPMRLDERLSSRLLYDHRWLLDPAIQGSYLALPFVRQYNEQRVYGRLEWQSNSVPTA